MQERRFRTKPLLLFRVKGDLTLNWKYLLRLVFNRYELMTEGSITLIAADMLIFYVDNCGKNKFRLTEKIYFLSFIIILLKQILTLLHIKNRGYVTIKFATLSLFSACLSYKCIDESKVKMKFQKQVREIGRPFHIIFS